MELKVGQILYKEKKDHRGNFTGIEVYEIEKIGNKYFYLKGNRFSGEGINKKTLAYESVNYSQFSYQMYLTEQEIVDKHERLKLIDLIRRNFEWGSKANNFTLEQLQNAVTALGL